MNRRDFLKVSFVGAVAVAAPVSLAESLFRRTPIIYGDGIHDDAEGLNAAFSGKSFIARNDCVHVSADRVELQGGSYSISTGIKCSDRRVSIRNAVIRARPELGDGPMLICEQSHVGIYDTIFHGTGYSTGMLLTKGGSSFSMGNIFHSSGNR